MRFFADAALALRLLARDWRAGELTLVAVAVVVAVASVTTVGFFADRVHQALSRQANQLLGADLVISGDRALDASFAVGIIQDFTMEAVKLGDQLTAAEQGFRRFGDAAPGCAEKVNAWHGKRRAATPAINPGGKLWHTN